MGEAAAVGVPDEMMGEKVGAAIVPAPGVELDVAAVIAHCRANLADFKVPQYVAVLSRAAAAQPRRQGAQGAAARRDRLGQAASLITPTGGDGMSQVQTVQGPIDADELGLTLAHEHLRFRDEAVFAQWPGRYDEQLELDAALLAVNDAKDRGVRTIVDATAMFGGRDVRFMKRVADETGVHVVACTGIYSYDYLPHYFENRDVDVMADHFVEDIERGCQGTDIRAAFLKCAADAAGVTEHVEKIHRAVARASVQTGAPIMAHSMPAVATGPRQVEIFAEEGVDMAKVQIAHCGDTEDVDYIEGADRQGRVRRARPLRPGDVPADRQAQRHRRRAAAPRPCRAADDLPGLLRDHRLVPARGRRGVRRPGRHPQLVDDARVRRGRARAA